MGAIDVLNLKEVIKEATVKAIAEEIVKHVKEDRLRVTIVTEPDRSELTVEPWEPYRMECPYGTKKE